MSSPAIPRVVPARLSFLAIYNPDLGRSDETFHRQIVFYYSKQQKARGGHERAAHELREQENEKLRQVGLAQAMVGFARSFSNGAAVDSVETHKSRIVLHELEEGWWILASIDLTQLPHAGANHEDPSSPPVVEYSSREVSPPRLLIQQLVRAHNIFRLHHGTTLRGMLEKHDRPKFTSILRKYWSRFAANWDVLLHGSPAVDLYNAMKLAAGGELGMGVGEEEWGSGERLVLEDFVHKTEGLVDLVVSRFGEPSPLQDPNKFSNPHELLDLPDSKPWIGSGMVPTAADGLVFSGVGAITRRSLRDLSHWVETIYSNGDHAYGVRDSPISDRRRRPRKVPPPTTPPEPSAQMDKQTSRGVSPTAKPTSASAPNIPPDLVKSAEASLNKASTAIDSAHDSAVDKQEPLLASLGDTETWMKYLTLGYGTAWGSKRAAADENAGPNDPDVANTPSEAPMRFVDPEPDSDHATEKLKAQVRQENAGYFAIGLKGDLGDGDADDSNGEGEWNNRTLLRTVYIELTGDGIPETPGTPEADALQFEKEPSKKPASVSELRSLRLVVYVHRPFIYTFLFHHRTASLTMASFYRNLHAYFSPLHRPLCNSTSPDKVAARISSSSNPYTTISSHKGSEPNTQPIYDLVYDPQTLTVHSSIPNIPDPGTLRAEGISSDASIAGWSRLEALNVHSHILATVTSTRRSLSEIERTCKTNRNWWVVWMRLPPSDVERPEESEAVSQSDTEFFTDQLREAFLIRRARDAPGASIKSSGSRFASGIWKPAGEKMGGAAAGWGPKGLAEGIGIDASRYVEGLLSLNR